MDPPRWPQPCCTHGTGVFATPRRYRSAAKKRKSAESALGAAVDDDGATGAEVNEVSANNVAAAAKSMTSESTADDCGSCWTAVAARSCFGRATKSGGCANAWRNCIGRHA